MSYAVAVSGRIAAGKSTLSRCLAERLGAPLVSFGDLVRAEAARQGVPSTRESLQELGQYMLDALGAQDFSLRAMDQAGATPADLPMIIEGVRHVIIRDAIVQLIAPRPLYLIYIDAPDETRHQRLIDRGTERAQISSFETHATEREVSTQLRELSDYVVSDTDTATACSDIADWLATRAP